MSIGPAELAYNQQCILPPKFVTSKNYSEEVFITAYTLISSVRLKQPITYHDLHIDLLLMLPNHTSLTHFIIDQ